MNVFDLSAKIAMDINGYLKSMDTAKGVAISTLSVIGGAVSDFMKSSIDAGLSFDKSISQVSATMGLNMAEMEEQTGSVNTQFGQFNGTLREFAQFMGRNTAFTATQASDALNYMALAGYDVQTSMEMLPNVLNLAAAGNFDLARASDMVTDTQTAFRISGKRTTKMVDEMAKAASTGNTSVEQLGDAFLVVGGLAADLNGGMVTLADGTSAETDGIQELEIALTAMANAGVKGSEAGTHMRNMLLKLSSPTEQGANAMEQLGVSVFDADGKMRSLRDIFGEMNTAMSNLTQQEKLQRIADLFNARDIASAEALLSAVSADWDHIGESILQADGAAAKMADTQLDNLAGDMTLFESALEGAKIAISDSLTPALRTVTQFGTETVQNLTSAFKDLPEPIQTTIGMIGLIGSKALEIAPQLIGIVSQLAQIAVAKKVLNEVNDGASAASGNLKNVAGNVGIVGAAIAAAVVTVTSMVSAWEASVKEEKEVRDRLEEVSENFDKTKKSSSELRDELKRLYTIEDKIAYVQEYMATTQDQYNQTVEVWRDAVRLAEEDANDYAFVMDKLSESSDKAAVSGGALLGELGNAYSTIHKLSNEVENGLVKPAEHAEWLQYVPFVHMNYEAIQLADNLKAVTDRQQINNETMQEAHDKMVEQQKAMSEAALMNEYLAHCAAIEAAAERDRTEALEAQRHTFEVVSVGGTTMSQDLYNASLIVTDAMGTMRDSISNSMGSTISWFEKLPEQAQVTAKEMYDNLNAQIEAFRNWEANLTYLADQGINVGYLQELAAAGPAGYAYAQAMVDDLNGAMTVGVDEWNAILSERQDMAAGIDEQGNELITKIGEITAGGEEKLELMAQAFGLKAGDTGKYIMTGLIDAVDDFRTEAEQQAKEVGEAEVDGIDEGAEVSSPSRRTLATGKFLMMGLGMGIRQNMDYATKSATLASDQTVSTFRNGMNSSIGSSIGAALVMGIGVGMRGQSGRLNSIASDVVNSAINSAKAVADIHSPSKVMEWVGEMFITGMAKGIEENAGIVADATQYAVEDAIPSVESMNDALSSMSYQGVSDSASTAGSIGQDIVVNVYGAQGQDVTELADQVITRIKRQLNRDVRYA